ncbi:uncharacterized protein V2V93DRAFT_375676 [Kockiozyma suomiensis]|uniref:uncharacterized protein n=1 Tax=Kockiozyma suomiensis TaxID=1337062 RepID=UPI003342EAC9
MSGILFTVVHADLHYERIEIREEIQRLRNKTMVTEMPSDVPEETWNYYVASLLSINNFRFSQRVNILEKSFNGGSEWLGQDFRR